MADKLARAKLARAARRFGAHSGDATLILLTDDERQADLLAAASALPRGSMVILRSRNASRRAAIAKALKTIARSRALKFLIAGDAALAQGIGADGIHLPQTRAREAAFWRARHPHWIITVAAHSLGACAHAPQADAILLGPVFVTGSHPGGGRLGTMRLRLIARQSPLPIYALGGIDARSAICLQGAQLAGLAAIGALSV
ncbi:MAG TPA: thiamine phosphate synthase [Rhizomicrobium sp.]